ncbi:MAG: aspartate--tRNA ligase [Clostridiales bacterium]|nr:aspartate--tRNA ligase [Clostridiales bacterium]
MAESMQGMKRTGKCTEFNVSDIGKKASIMGWVNKRRNLGGVIFIDVRDVSGIIQIVFKSELDADIFEKAETLRNEFVVAISGKIIKRDEETINPNLKTGYIEIAANELKILSEAATPPIDMDENSKTNELLRLKYRYLDLRRKSIQKNFILRHKAVKVTRDFFDENGFLDIETPFMTKSTPEGARDYLVPSRVNKGRFYALPQSPQIFKQLLMVSGFDRYMQIVRCFRDEDLRADRQPEFTQIDIEMSFVEENDVIEINEKFVKRLMKEVMDVDLQLPLKSMTYQEAMDRFGSDKPDVRFGFELVDLSDLLKNCGFRVFSGAVENGGSVRAINAKGCGEKFSRREIDALVEYVKIYGAKGMAWISVEESGLKSAITKFLSEDEVNKILETVKAEPGDLICFIADKNKVVYDSLGALRLEFARKLDLIKDKEEFSVLWVTHFPLMEYDEEEKRWTSTHHPFTSPIDEDLEKLETDPGSVRAKAYDLILNGVELGGGSIRIHRKDIQKKIFNLLGFTDEEAHERFGFLLEAFEYGVPPHGGIAYGLDRLIMILAREKSIRDVIAFPKIQNASCPMTEAPSIVDDKQLKELAIKIDQDEL